MLNKYELTIEEIEELYDYLFTQKEQFVHKADPNKPPKLNYVEKVLDSSEEYVHALILFRNSYSTYEEAYDKLDDYSIYDSEQSRDEAFEQTIQEQAEFLVEDALVDGLKSWLAYYIDIDEVANDMTANRSYAEVLSSYEEEVEATVDGITYYLYRC